ncbi:hypothetical protein PCC7424_4179 [Gloeothece citriformis PCC 7424]|uniref:Uncharacterized protein n=1 Tax=Gloeothece citriformis (strain PCC 7424) TaxID=65393 RepID=B7KLH7_GLOC7|nr:hypothetical protein [Gloeothece citriformis]ACK72549.1 hypothetical protein PCC7424_4179 [Gloeothece citriformis PCC 7424]
MKPNALIIDSKQARLQRKSLDTLNPQAKEFNFELWATLVRAQMRQALRHTL